MATFLLSSFNSVFDQNLPHYRFCEKLQIRDFLFRECWLLDNLACIDVLHSFPTTHNNSH